MSKHNRGRNAPVGVPMDARVIYDHQISMVEGRILTFIESLGFSEVREKAVKDIIRGILYTELYVNSPLVLGKFINEAIQKDREGGYASGMMDTCTGVPGPNVVPGV